jgi:hypothetical protein
MSTILFKKYDYAYDEELGGEIPLSGIKGKIIKKSFDEVYYSLNQPIEGKGFIREYYSEPTGTDEGTILYDLIKSVE